MRTFISLLLLITGMACTSPEKAPSSGESPQNCPSIRWEALQNPVYAHDNWSVKDACMVCRDSTYYIFFSAFFHDDYDTDKRVRSHVTAVKTKDFMHYSDTLFMWDGMADGWIGMCSPNLTQTEDYYYLTYNSWGDKEGKHNQLFYARSKDLENWEKHLPLAHNLTQGLRAIDAGVAAHNDRFYLIWKESKGLGNDDRVDLPRLAVSESMSGDFRKVYSGYPDFRLKSGIPNEKTHENFEFLQINGKWHLLATDYFPHNPYLYEMGGNPDDKGNWLKWVNGYKLEVPVEQGFNTSYTANAAFLANWKPQKGYYYLLYAGRTQDTTFWTRGDNKLGLARSKDLTNWEVP